MFTYNKKRYCPSCNADSISIIGLIKSTKYSPTNCDACGKAYAINNTLSEVLIALFSSLIFVFILAVASSKSLIIPALITILTILVIYLVKLFEAYKSNLIEVEIKSKSSTLFSKVVNAVFWALIVGFWIFIAYLVLKFKGVI